MLDSVLKGCIIFNEDGVKKHEFRVRVGNDRVPHGLALHPLGEYVFVVGVDVDRDILTVEMYSKDGEFYREIILPKKGPSFFPRPSVAISKKGRLATTSGNGGVGAMVYVL